MARARGPARIHGAIVAMGLHPVNRWGRPGRVALTSRWPFARVGSVATIVAIVDGPRVVLPPVVPRR